MDNQVIPKTRQECVPFKDSNGRWRKYPIGYGGCTKCDMIKPLQEMAKGKRGGRCRKCRNAEKTARERNRRQTDPAYRVRLRERQKKKDYYKNRLKLRDIRRSQQLTDHYVRGVLSNSTPRSLITPEMIVAKREQLRAWRAGGRIRPRLWNTERHLKNAFLVERRQFLKGDEQTHWGNHPEAVLQRKKAWQKKFLPAYNKRRRLDPVFRIICNHRTRIHSTLRRGNAMKAASTLKMLGCSGPFLIKWIQQAFQPGMSWDNYGSEWHLDHIRPIASYDLTKASEQRKCFHYTNLQPLWKLDNRLKWDRMVIQTAFVL